MPLKPGRRGLALPALLLPLPAAAHELRVDADSWTLLSALLLAIAWGLYALGAQRKPPSPARAAGFHAALVIAALALFGPLDSGAQNHTSLHMLQHMLLMVVIAPLVAIAVPLPQWQAATGRPLRALGSVLRQSSRRPLSLALVHGALIWLWHTPRLYLLALAEPGWHFVEHASFLLSAGLFWWSVLHAGVRRRGEALLALLLTLMHTGLLGALLTFGRESFYGAERSLFEQQLAGLIMWVPGGVVYLLAAGAIAWRCLGDEAPAPGRRSGTAGA
jgi:putative membrane protein